MKTVRIEPSVLKIGSWVRFYQKLFTPIAIYAAMTPPAIVAIPPVQIACNSDFVKSFRNGAIIIGASIC